MGEDKRNLMEFPWGSCPLGTRDSPLWALPITPFLMILAYFLYPRGNRGFYRKYAKFINGGLYPSLFRKRIGPHIKKSAYEIAQARYLDRIKTVQMAHVHV